MFHDAILRIAAQGFAVALIVAALIMPGCMLLARRWGVVDRPGGRKTHAQVTPLLGGLGVVLAVTAGFLVVWWQSERILPYDLRFGQIGFVIAGSLVLFTIGLVDDVFKDSMTFQPKLLGQIVGVLVLMYPTLYGMLESGQVEPRQWLYQLFFLGWYLTIVNSFNFSDNMNGLMSGLSIIAFAAAVFYLQNTESQRSMLVAVLLVGGLLGFLPYNFPRSRIFLGDAGSMFVGFWMAWIQFDLTEGFMSAGKDFGAHHLIPAVLIMGLPLFDAVFVVFMRLREGRPIYLGDNHHLSHRLVRGGFTAAEAVVILWGLGLILASVGSLAAGARPSYRWMILGASFLFMVAVTRAVIALERAACGASGTAAIAKRVVLGDEGSSDGAGSPGDEEQHGGPPAGSAKHVAAGSGGDAPGGRGA